VPAFEANFTEVLAEKSWIAILAGVAASAAVTDDHDGVTGRKNRSGSEAARRVVWQ
jgi:hypothetical protein